MIILKYLLEFAILVVMRESDQDNGTTGIFSDPEAIALRYGGERGQMLKASRILKSSAKEAADPDQRESFEKHSRLLEQSAGLTWQTKPRAN